MKTMIPGEGRVFESDEDAEFGRVLSRLRLGKRDLLLSRKPHNCARATCNPESEPTLVALGHLTAPAISTNVFLCRYGTIHVCSTSNCTIYLTERNQTCTISGFQLGTLECSYDKNDYRTWNSKATMPSGDSTKRDRVLGESLDAATASKRPKKQPAKKKPKRMVQHVLSDAQVKNKASETVMNLLFSSNRAKRNADAIADNRHLAIKRRNTYIARRFAQRQLPYLTDIYRLMGDATSRPHPLMEFVYDEGLHNYYVMVILQIWQLTLKHMIPIDEKEYDEDTGVEIIPRVDLDMVALGTMYQMRQGVTRKDVMLLPRDEFLLASLPLIHEMSYFGINKKHINKGITLLNAMYDNAISAGVSTDELVLDVSKLPEKNNDRIFKKLGGGGD